MKAATARARIAEVSDLNIYISLTDEEGDGTVVAVKDAVRVKGTVTTGGGIILPRVVDTEDAPVVANIRRAGGLVIGKTNMHEWSFGVTSANVHYGPVRNPHDPSRVAGGSSGGSAAAVAARTCDWALGADAGGSIRIPASLCGVVGFKPTLGTVSTDGAIPLAPSMDTLGPLAPDVTTAARAFEMILGRGGFVSRQKRPLADFKLAIPAGWVDQLDIETESAWRRVSKELPEVDFPDRETMSEEGLHILLFEAAAFHRQWVREHPEKYSDEVRGYVEWGLTITEEQYQVALDLRPEVRSQVENAMRDIDAILLPTTAIVAPFVGQADVLEPLTRFTRLFNPTGHPVITLPVPATKLPVGIQVVGHFGQDAALIEVAWALENAWRTEAAGIG